MANKKLAPNRGKHSAAKEAEESALQLARSPLPGTRRRVPPFASDAAENTAPSPPKNTASSPAKDMGPAPAKNTAPSSAKNQAPASSNEDEEAVPPFASDDAENTAPAPAKNTASASAKNKDPTLDKNNASASAKNKAPVPDKNKASASAKNAVAVPAASDEDEVAAPPQDTTLRRFINFLCEKAASMRWRGLLDAFLTWVHSSAGDEAEAPTEGSAHQEQREKRYLEEAKNTQQQASPQLPEERRCRNYAYIYAKDAGHRKGHDCDKIEADRSVPTDLSISQHGRDFDEAEADRIIPAGPSISKIVEDSQKFDRYLSSDIHKDYIKIMSSCPPGMEVCTFCYFEKDIKTRRSQSHRIPHVRDWHDNLAGVKCTNCPARFPNSYRARPRPAWHALQCLVQVLPKLLGTFCWEDPQ